MDGRGADVDAQAGSRRVLRVMGSSHISALCNVRRPDFDECRSFRSETVRGESPRRPRVRRKRGAVMDFCHPYDIERVFTSSQTRESLQVDPGRADPRAYPRAVSVLTTVSEHHVPSPGPPVPVPLAEPRRLARVSEIPTNLGPARHAGAASGWPMSYTPSPPSSASSRTVLMRRNA